MRVYCYWLKGFQEVYGWTDSKSMAKRFEDTRYMKVFKKKVIDLDSEHEYPLFSSEFFRQKLEEIPLTDSEMKDIVLVGTSDENFELSEAFNDLIDSVVFLKNHFRENYRLTKKYNEALQILSTHSGFNDDKEEPIVDTFALFYYLFHGTFCNDPEWKPPLNNGESFLPH